MLMSAVQYAVRGPRWELEHSQESVAQVSILKPFLSIGVRKGVVCGMVKVKLQTCLLQLLRVASLYPFVVSHEGTSVFVIGDFCNSVDHVYSAADTTSYTWQKKRLYIILRGCAVWHCKHSA